MALLIRTLQRSRISPFLSPKTLISSIRSKLPLQTPQSRDTITSSTSLLPWQRSYSAIATSKSPFRSNLLRIISKEIDYQSNYAPPHQPSKEFKSFSVEDRPGEQYIVMKGKFGEKESIKMEATMFDGFMSVPRTGLDASGRDVHLHLSLIIDISKNNGSDDVEFICSVWPKRVDIQRVYMRRKNKTTGLPYIGPKFSSLKYDFQTAMKEFLRARGIDEQLCFFLHEYMTNKNSIERIQWLGKLNSFISK